MISSEACLNLVATASAFRSLGDARRFMQDLAAPVAAVLVPPARSAPGKAPLISSKPTSLCSNYRSVSQPAYQAVSWAAHKRVTVTILWQGCISMEHVLLYDAFWEVGPMVHAHIAHRHVYQ